jgi:metabolite-proton symporter
MVRAVVASAVGTAIEWYDFFLYGVAAALVFPQRFFPQSDPLTGTLLSFSTFFVGFIGRPIGAAIFGHYGDRIGRMTSLVATLLLMGLATMSIGLVPDYSRIGIWGGVLLTVGRIVQGIAVGGQWGGSVLLATEWGDGRRRGFLASWPQFGAPVGLVLANAALLAMTYLSGDAFLSWGWRIPFLASAALVIIALYIRVGIPETPVFMRLKSEGKLAVAPVTVVLRDHWREVILTALVRSAQQAPFYIFTTYVLTYATAVLGFARSTILNFVMLQSLVSMVTVVLFGHLSDRIGRRRLTAIGCAIMLVYPFIYFALLDTATPLLVLLAIVSGMPVQDIQYGPQAALIAESFPSRVRYTGTSLGYQLASITAGGPAPLIAVWAYERFHSSTAVAVYLAASAVVSLIALWLLPQNTRDFRA